MEQRKLLIFLLVVFFTISTQAADRKMIEVGKIQATIFDDGIQSHTNKRMSHVIYPRGSFAMLWHYELTDTDWAGGVLRNAALLVGNRNWTDTLGRFWPYHVTGHCSRRSAGPGDNWQFNIPDEQGYTIRRFIRYPWPHILVDGQPCETPFYLQGDEVNPDTIWGTADMMVECHYRLSNGLDVYQRNLAWSMPAADDYVIWDLTFINTGNTNRDDEIELPGQTLDSLVILRHWESLVNPGLFPFASWCGVTEPDTLRLSQPTQDDDSLRMSYVACARKEGHDYDSYGHICQVDWEGDPNLVDGARWTGHVILFAPKNTQVHQTHPIGNISDIAAANDPAQPSMHSSIENLNDDAKGGVLYYLGNLSDTSDHREPYRCLRKGIRGYNDTTVAECQNVPYMKTRYNVYDTTAMGAKTYYDMPQDRIGEFDPGRGQIYPRRWTDYYTFCTAPKFSIGPYNMGFQDTLRFVFALVVNSISRKTSYMMSDMWVNNNARNYDWVADMDSASIMQGYLARDPVAEIYHLSKAGDLWPGGIGTRLNNIAKDYIVSTGKDSIFIDGMHAQRSFNLNYEVPASPNPPSVFEVISKPDKIELNWSYESGFEPSDLVGFKIYRAQGATVFERSPGGSIVGDWVFVDSIGGAERSYDDVSVVPAFDYYYYITAVSSAGIESGKFLTMTQEPFAARLTDEPGEHLYDVRVVPNPYNIGDTEGGGSFPEEDKIAFRDLPPICTIRIFTESGELVKTIEHDDGSGSAFWQTQQYLTTVKNQKPASGLYIAHIETPTGEWVSRKFIIIR